MSCCKEQNTAIVSHAQTYTWWVAWYARRKTCIDAQLLIEDIDDNRLSTFQVPLTISQSLDHGWVLRLFICVVHCTNHLGESCRCLPFLKHRPCWFPDFGLCGSHVFRRASCRFRIGSSTVIQGPIRRSVLHKLCLQSSGRKCHEICAAGLFCAHASLVHAE